MFHHELASGWCVVQAFVQPLSNARYMTTYMRKNGKSSCHSFQLPFASAYCERGAANRGQWQAASSPTYPPHAAAPASAPALDAALNADLRHVAVGMTKFMRAAHGRSIRFLSIETIRDAHSQLQLLSVQRLEWAEPRFPPATARTGLSNAAATSQRSQSVGPRPISQHGHDGVTWSGGGSATESLAGGDSGQSNGTCLIAGSKYREHYVCSGPTTAQPHCATQRGMFGTYCHQSASPWREVPSVWPSGTQKEVPRSNAARPWSSAALTERTCSRPGKCALTTQLGGFALEAGVLGVPRLVNKLARELETMRDELVFEHEMSEFNARRVVTLEQEKEVWSF